jgi:uncharacterized membrane protein SpoIIM required for sporulation
MKELLIAMWFVYTYFYTIQNSKIDSQKRAIEELSTRMIEQESNNHVSWFNLVMDNEYIIFLFIVFLVLFILFLSLYCAYSIGFIRGFRFSSTNSNNNEESKSEKK